MDVDYLDLYILGHTKQPALAQPALAIKLMKDVVAEPYRTKKLLPGFYSIRQAVIKFKDIAEEISNKMIKVLFISSILIAQALVNYRNNICNFIT